MRTRLVQVRLFGHLWAVVLGSRKGAEGGISSFQAFCVGLASRVGTGNIAGVAIALTVGGPGAAILILTFVGLRLVASDGYPGKAAVTAGLVAALQRRG